MRAKLLVLTVAAVLALPLASAAQALPDEVRAAGVTVAAWNGVQLEVRRASAEKHVSEKALASVCAKMGVALVKNGALDLRQLISLIDGRADEINALYKRLTLLAQEDDPITAGLLQSARSAIDAGEPDQADGLLEQARQSARTSRENAQRREAEVIATEAQVKSLRFDYLGAAATYADAADALPPDARRDRWRYAISQAQALETRSRLFDEPQPLEQALHILRDVALPLVPRNGAEADWAETQIDLGNELEVLGERGDAQALADAIVTFRLAQEVLTRDRDPAGWARAQGDVGNALLSLGDRGDDQALRDAVAAYRLALEVWTPASFAADAKMAANKLARAEALLAKRAP